VAAQLDAALLIGIEELGSLGARSHALGQVVVVVVVAADETVEAAGAAVEDDVFAEGEDFGHDSFGSKGLAVEVPATVAAEERGGAQRKAARSWLGTWSCGLQKVFGQEFPRNSLVEAPTRRCSKSISSSRQHETALP